jgi:hypothetical protein
MTHKSPYAWPSPSARAPQHTCPPGKLPARVRTRRALRLAAVASVWVTGLAVVVIAVAMVAMTTAPSARTGQAASAGFTASAAAGHAAGQTSQTSRAGQPAPHARAIQPARPAVTSLVFSGQGSANTTPFAIGGQGRWKVTWSYDCGGQAPGFTIRQTPAPAPAAGTAGLTVTRTGASGRGVAWAGHDPGQHALRIRTACTWHLAVTSYS